MSQIPRLEKNAVSHQLLVKGKPFLILGAELQNSSMTSAAYMRTVWQKIADMHVNTVLGCVCWESIEPVEGQFDFSELDQIIHDARSHGLHLILLWFGSFKNGLSTYVPRWVKTDYKRFPRMHIKAADSDDSNKLQTADVLSIFHTEAQKCDARAFGELLKHLKQVDGDHSTVIMVQVENETGLLGDSRNRSAAANKRFAEDVPAELISFLEEEHDSLHEDLKENLEHFTKYIKSPEAEWKSKSWEAAFGKSKHTDELFMAYHYAKYLDQVAAAGKAAYPIPLYTNVWLNYVGKDGENDFPAIAGGGGDPGDYPSGGGVTNVLDIWMKFAPNLDLIAPDIYLNDYVASCRQYRHRNQPLFIPEQRRDEYGARRVWAALGSFQALGTSPFGIDTLGVSNPFTTTYGLLSSVSDIILDAQRRPGSSLGFFFDELPPPSSDGKQRPDPSPPITATFGSYEVRIERCFVFGHPGAGAGMIIHINSETPSEPPRFILIGYGFQAVFRSLNTKSIFTGILNFLEKEPIRGPDGKTELRTLRRLNGDETRSGRFAMMPGPDPDYGGFPICVTIPARTMVAEVEPYSLEEEGEL
ncbi:hypothetical protein VTN77DRAFT_9798 [Rasamsonia byssochlamydoides]|uniref:uncharacterized protein n=1 Tax=Rasamsonia byssochlamydoides TaxID=89139 RepID=UPI0037432BAE